MSAKYRTFAKRCPLVAIWQDRNFSNFSSITHSVIEDLSGLTHTRMLRKILVLLFNFTKYVELARSKGFDFIMQHQLSDIAGTATAKLYIPDCACEDWCGGQTTTNKGIGINAG